MMQSRRQIWLYPMFQVPLMLMLGCLILAALFSLLGWGRPTVGVAIALDLSSSTQGAVRQEEIAAVKSYLAENQSLKNQNQIRVFGFASNVQALTNEFITDSQAVERQLDRALQDTQLQRQLGGGTNINLAIQQVTNALSSLETNRCRELLLVTDGEADVSQTVVDGAINQGVKINAVVLGGKDAVQIRQATASTNGIYLNGEAGNLKALFTDEFFTSFNSNKRWLTFWLSCAFICAMWAIALPLDRWLFQGLMKLDMTLAGQLALGNALFWTVVTALVVWRIFGLPFGSAC
ncbi:MAG TPA: VWA domain-containing protein [Oscillatoriaceae cyanobacterium M33_DOE_052]|uniref:VWA domain-containing protein n=1 Tax=Planktothricoides sp. SpSt-374 TaxID=2282167 RepID=A0A7C3VFN4_9CYAN|nr:VWA domain-containing protein [Oscillatoriaceae cyanobacterium M33_DOE_052]